MCRLSAKKYINNSLRSTLQSMFNTRISPVLSPAGTLVKNYLSPIPSTKTTNQTNHSQKLIPRPIQKTSNTLATSSYKISNPQHPKLISAQKGWMKFLVAIWYLPQSNTGEWDRRRNKIRFFNSRVRRSRKKSFWEKVLICKSKSL